MVQELLSQAQIEARLYPESDGKPMADNTVQFRLMTTIVGGFSVLFKERQDVFVAGDLLWYPKKKETLTAAEKKLPSSQAPDIMVVLGVEKKDRGSYKQWEEGNIVPQVAIEIVSPSNDKGGMENKFRFYDYYGVEEYYVYDPELNQLQGWLRSGGKLIEIPQMEGWRSPLLGVSFSTSEKQLQVFAPTGEMFETYEDVVRERDRATERAESAESDLQQLREKLRQLNIDPDSL
ncbi:MAG: Uma2 family endonuclease [Roseofilum sp. SBFL]|nr:Uma2 family endonuclease [Roseofilum sp. SID3]MBP0013733.1 Uma2 family endonuclease [Roseofilum sp. SID3]MBP0024125.1 Uma2 family endonuclease [Roseofilum sp. SID2]MBP0037521.1 Uma2 family endonuclease [Roseofilum sp. SID1]MBP0042862.1 Uma2 family endonuclease [Roseofilum sp. SBFL]